MKKSTMLCLVAVFALSACGVSVLDFLGRNTNGTAEGTGFIINTYHVVTMSGEYYIPPGEQAIIHVTLENPRNLIIASPVFNGNTPAPEITAIQSGASEISLTIPSPVTGTYNLSLRLGTADNNQDFEPYQLPIIHCKPFHEISVMASGGSLIGTFPDLMNFDSVTAGNLRRVPEGIMVSFSARPNYGLLPSPYSFEYTVPFDSPPVPIIWALRSNFSMPGFDINVTIDFVVADFINLGYLINASASGETIYIPGGNYTVTEKLTINNNITLIPEGSVILTRAPVFYDPFFEINGGSLVLKTEGGGELTLNGNMTTPVYNVGSLMIVNNSGKLILEGNVTLKNNKTTQSTAGAVGVSSNGIFIMGTTGNNSMPVIEGNEGGYSGGVSVYGGTFEMYGGIIRNNVCGTYWGGGVGIEGVFIMTGGIITGNSVLSPGPRGAGVGIYDGTCTIRGSTLMVYDNVDAIMQGDVTGMSTFPSISIDPGTVDVFLP